MKWNGFNQSCSGSETERRFETRIEARVRIGPGTRTGVRLRTRNGITPQTGIGPGTGTKAGPPIGAGSRATKIGIARVRRRFAVPALALMLTLLLAFGSVLGPRAQAAEYPLDLLSAGSAGGDVVRIVMGVEGNDYDRLRVGIFEEVAGGTSHMLRAAVWMAAIVASQIAASDLFDYTIYFDFPGTADGPSAGAIKTAALLSVWLGHELSPDVVMTGTINPDGTIGNVGGVPFKIEAAAEAGKSLVLIPKGNAVSMSSEGDLIDNVEHGRSLGIEVRTVGNIYEAYPFLVGQSLPRLTDKVGSGSPLSMDGTSEGAPSRSGDKAPDRVQTRLGNEAPDPAPAPLGDGSSAGQHTRSETAASDTTDPFATLSLPAPVVDAAIRIFAEWADVLEQLLSLAKQLGIPDEQLDGIRAARREADNALDDGRPAVALDLMTDAVIEADVVASVFLFIDALKENGPLGMLQYVLAETDMSGDMLERAGELNDFTPAEMSTVQAVLEAGKTMVDALGIYQVAHERLVAALDRFDIVDKYDPEFQSIADNHRPIPISHVEREAVQRLDDEDMDDLVEELLDALVFFRLAYWLSQMPFQHLELNAALSAHPGDGGPYTELNPRPGSIAESVVLMDAYDDVEKLARQYAAGLRAISVYFDSLVLDQFAEATGLRLEPMRNTFMRTHWEYAFNYGAGRFLEDAKDLNPFLQLGAAGSTYLGIARLLTGYDSLEGQYDPDGELMAVNEEALEQLLALARDEALLSVAAAKRLGVEPIQSLVNLELAAYYRDGSPDERVHALYLLWQADFFAKTMLRLAL